MCLAKSKKIKDKIIASGLSFLLLFSNFPQEALASRSNAGGGKAAKFDVGKVAMSIGIAVGSAAIGSALSSAWSSSSQAAQQSAQTAQEGMKILQEATPLLHSPELLAVTATAGQATQTIPLAFLSASSSISTITPITQEGVQLAQAAGQAVHAAQTASTLSKFTQPFVNLGKGIYNAPSTMKFIAQNPKTFTDGFTLAFKTSNIVPTVIKGYNTYVAVTQVSRAVGTMASYKKWEPASTFLVSTVATMTTAGFLNPAASLGDSLSKTSADFAMPAMLKGAGVGAMGGLAGAGLTIAVDADRMNKDPKDRSRDRSPSIGGRILGMAGTMLGTTLGRTLVDPKTYETQWVEYESREVPAIDKTGKKITESVYVPTKSDPQNPYEHYHERDLKEKMAGVSEIEQALKDYRDPKGKVLLFEDEHLTLEQAQRVLLSHQTRHVGGNRYEISGKNSVIFSLPEDKARFLESMRSAPDPKISLEPGPGAEFIAGETPAFEGSHLDLTQRGVKGIPTAGRTVAIIYLPQNISGYSLPLQRIFLTPLVETLNMWPLLAANALEIVVREKYTSGSAGQQSIWQPLISGAVMALAAPVFESLANTYKLKPSLFSDIDQKLGYFPELQYARAEMFKDAIVRKGAKDVSKLSKEELTKEPTPVEKRELEDKINEEEFKLEEVEMQQEMHRLQNLPLSELEKEVLPKEIHLLKLKQEISASSEEKELLENKISEKKLKLAKANFNQEMKRPLTMDPIMDGLTTDRLTKYDPISKEIESRKNKLNEEIDLLKLKQEISLPVDLMERFSTTEQIQILSTLQAAKGKATIKGKNWTVGDTRGALLEGLMAVANTRGAEKAVTAQIASSPSTPRNDHSQDIFDHRPVLESMGGSRLGIVFDRTKDVFRYDLPVSLLSGIMEVGLNEINGVNKIQRLENKIAKLNSQKVRTGKDIAKIEKMEEKIDSLLLPSMLTSLGTNRITGAARGIAVYLYGKHLERKQKDEIETFGDKWEPALLTQRSLTDPVQIILARIEGTIPLLDDKKYDYKAVEYYNPDTGKRLNRDEFKQEVLEPILTEAEGKVDEESYEVLKELDLYTFKRKLQNERAAASLLPSLREKSDALNKWEEIGNIKENPNGSFKLAPGAEIPIDSTRYYLKRDEGKLIASEEYRKVRKIEGYARSLDPDTLSPAKAYFLLTNDPTKVVPLKDYDIAKVPSLGQAIMGSVTQGSFEFGWKGLAMGLPHRPEGKLSAFEWYSYTRNLNSLASASASAAKGQGYANTMLRHQANVATGMSTNNLFTILNEAIDLGMAKVVGVSGYKKGLPGYKEGLPYNEVLLLDVGWNDKDPRFYPYWPFFEVTPVPNDHFWSRINKGLKQELKKELKGKKAMSDTVKRVPEKPIAQVPPLPTLWGEGKATAEEIARVFSPQAEEKALEELSGWELHKMHNPELYEKKELKEKELHKMYIPPEPKSEDIKPWGPDSGLPPEEREKEIDSVFRPKPKEKALEELSGWELHKMHNPELYEKKEAVEISLPKPDQAEEIARQLELRNNKSSDSPNVNKPFVSAGQDVIDSKPDPPSEEVKTVLPNGRIIETIYNLDGMILSAYNKAGEVLTRQVWSKDGVLLRATDSETSPVGLIYTFESDETYGHRTFARILGGKPEELEANYESLPDGNNGKYAKIETIGDVSLLTTYQPSYSKENVTSYLGNKYTSQVNKPILKDTNIIYSLDYNGEVIGLDSKLYYSSYDISPFNNQNELKEAYDKGRITYSASEKLRNKEVIVSPFLVTFLEDLKKRLKQENPEATIGINSGYRNPKYQIWLAGIGNGDASLISEHSGGGAADVNILGVGPQKVYEILKGLLDKKGGLGVYHNSGKGDPSHWHVDIRDKVARWEKGLGNGEEGIIPQDRINDPHIYREYVENEIIEKILDRIKKLESTPGPLTKLESIALKYCPSSVTTLGPYQINDELAKKMLRKYHNDPDVKQTIEKSDDPILKKIIDDFKNPQYKSSPADTETIRKFLLTPDSRVIAKKVIQEELAAIRGLAAKFGEQWTDERAVIALISMYNQGRSNVLKNAFLYQIDQLAKGLGKSIDWIDPSGFLPDELKPVVSLTNRVTTGLRIDGSLSPQQVDAANTEIAFKFLNQLAQSGKVPITLNDVQEAFSRKVPIGESTIVPGKEVSMVPIPGINPRQALNSPLFTFLAETQPDFHLFPSPKQVLEKRGDDYTPSSRMLHRFNYGTGGIKDINLPISIEQIVRDNLKQNPNPVFSLIDYFNQ